ncbi:MAG: hypothetical protein JO199_11010 [Candidatus Eremiobacteraeota bacterium]|nr:hypothetical protein [Candidatus Eremiobacteraeota bacterium]
MRKVTSVLLAAGMLAACSGGAGTNGNAVTPSTPAAHHKFAWHGALGKLAVRIGVPAHAAHPHGAKLNPKYIPQSAANLCFSLVSVNGQSTSDDGLCDGSNPFDFSFPTSGSGNHCTPVSDPTTPGYTCSVTQAAPAASDQWTIVASAPSKIYSESKVTISVPAGGTATGNFTLNPAAATVAFVPGTSNSADSLVPIKTAFSNGTGTPYFDGTGYSCPTPVNGGCYEPLLNDNSVSLADAVTLHVLDASNNIIIPSASGQTVSGSPNIPVFINPATGNAANVTLSCTRGDIVPIASTTGDAPPIYWSTLYTDTADGANGYTGNGIVSGSPINSPVTNKDGTAGGGTDFNGSTQTIFGNNLGFVNFSFDNGDTETSRPGFGLQSCTATLKDAVTANTISTATLEIGFAAGSVTWGSNGAHRHSNVRGKR